MKFWVVTLTATLLALTGRMSWAIGLGDIATQSFVNGPLNATIEVLQPSGLSEVEVIPSLASIDDFDRLGLDRHYSLSRLLFEPDFPVSSHLKTRLDLVIQKTAINLPFTFTLTGRDHRGIRTYLCLQKCLGYW